eukprot:symbB.v1.2.004429.t1/scaffold248.1/size253060/5
MSRAIAVFVAHVSFGEAKTTNGSLSKASSSNEAQLAQLLLAAASGDGRVRGPAQARLEELESHPGFVPVLLAAYADANIDAQGRYLSILMCKNVIDRQWQPRWGNPGIH